MIRWPASRIRLYIGPMSPIELFNEARLAEAVAAQQAVVARRPDDVAERLLLCDLLAFTGDRDAVREHLDAIRDESTDLQAYLEEWRDLLLADDARHAGARPAFFVDPPAHVERRLAAAALIQAGRDDDAIDCLDDADEMAPCVAGYVDGRHFEGWRDSDDWLGPVLECFRDGRYYWVAADQVHKLRLEPAESLRDSLYRPAVIELGGQRIVDVFLPVLYTGTARHAEDGIRTGAGIDWEERNGLMRGLGSRTWLFGDEELTLSEMVQIEIRPS
jgi:protein involved in temperature-dependent protein secretion